MYLCILSNALKTGGIGEFKKIDKNEYCINPYRYIIQSFDNKMFIKSLKYLMPLLVYRLSNNNVMSTAFCP